MTTEPNNGTTSPDAVAAALAAKVAEAVAGEQQPEPEKKEPTPLADAQDAATAEREAAEKKAADDAQYEEFKKRYDAEHGETVREAEESALPAGVKLEIPEHIKYSDRDLEILTTEVSPLLGEAGYNAPQQQRIVDLFSEEVLAHHDAPTGGEDTHDRNNSPDAVLGYLKTTWGSEFETRLATAQKAMKSLPKRTQNYLEETGLGNAPSVLNVLANLGEGLMGLTKAQATAKLDEMRKDPSGAYRNANHEGHKLAVARARVLTQAAAHGDDPQAFEKAVSKQLTGEIERTVRKGAGAAAPAPAAASAKPDLEARIRELRAQRGKTKMGSPEQKLIDLSIAAEYRRLYPGEEA